MAATLGTQTTQVPLPIVNFTWSPVGAAVTYNLAGNSYPPAGTRFEAFYTPVATLLTFVATAIVSQGVSVIQYRWDMGDGTVKFGSTIGHTYTVPNPSLTARLECTDALGRKVYVAKSILLQVQFGTVVQSHVRV